MSINSKQCKKLKFFECRKTKLVQKVEIKYDWRVPRKIVTKLIIHLKKLLGSDWLKRSAFLGNTVQKSVTRVQITMKTAGGPTDVFRRPLKIVWNLPKISEDHTKPSKDYRRPHETFRRFPKIAQTLLKITRILPKFSEDRPNTSEDLRQSPEISKDHRIFSKLFQVLEDRRQYLLCTSVVNVWSEALSCLFFQVYY